MFDEHSTVAAISTPPGAGGIGVIRISGADSFAVADKIFRANNKKSIFEMNGYTSALGRVYDGDGPVDDAIAQVFRAPKSYTGEDVVELSCHGGLWILQKVLRLCLENGAQPANPGEFTKRAFLNGKLNLTQAEAVMDLISAQGQSAAKAALSARDGMISTRINKIVEKLVSQSAHLAAWADFPDEDLETLDRDLFSTVLEEAVRTISDIVKTYDAGKILREGISTAIVGKPNVGKSTLMNLLSGEERSIVTDIPGTTRDVVEDTVRLGDFILRLADTAGIRETDDPVENAGVERSRLQIQTAELIFAVFDSSDELDAQDLGILDALAGKPCVAVVNKIDLPKRLDISWLEAKIPKLVTISAKTGDGVKELEAAVSGLLGLSSIDATAGIIANERQRVCLVKAKESLGEAKTALVSGMLDAANACVDYAIDELLILTGERASDRVVDEVFARFCVGK